MRKGLILVAMALCAGCATRPVSELEARPVPTERQFAFSQGAESNITIVRDKGMMGGGCLLELRVDGTKAALIDTAEKVTIALPSGVHTLGATPSGAGLCGSGLATRSSRSVQVTLQPSSRLVYRVATDSSGAIDIGPNSF